MSSKKNEFALVMKLATSDKYKDKPLVSSLVSRINFLKQKILVTQANISVSVGYINGLEGKDGYSPFVWGGLNNVQAAVDINVELRLLTEFTMLLVEILNENGAGLII